MKKIVFLVFLIFNTIYAMQDLTPIKSFVANGNVSDIVVDGNKIYASTNAGSVDIFDKESTKLLNSIKVPKVKDFMGDMIDAKVYCVDVYKDKVVLVSQSKDGYSEVYIYSNNNLKKIISVDDYLLVRKTKFVDQNRILIVTLSSTVILYNTSNNFKEYEEQLSYSSFADIQMSEDKTNFIFTDESGVIKLVDTYTAKIKKEYPAKNLDKIFQLSYKNGIVLTAGQDRKAVVYNSFSNYSKDYDFLLYSCALSPSAKYGAIAFNEQNEIVVFDVEKNKDLYILKGQKSTLTKIVFLDENTIIASSEDEKINLWNLK